MIKSYSFFFILSPTCLATALARSLQVSVLPVPAGPSGAPPRFNFRAPINVLKNQNVYQVNHACLILS